MSTEADALERRTRQLTEGSLLAGAFRGAGQTLQAMALSLWWGFPLGKALALAVTLIWFRRSASGWP